MKKIMKQFSSAVAVAAVAGTCLLPVHAEDYSNTEEWYTKCTKPQSSAEDVKACEGFQEYQNEKRQQLSASIKNFNESIASLENDVERVSALAQEQKALEEELATQISQKEAAIASLDANIIQLENDIAAKQQEIEMWDSQIKERMRSEQSALGTNMLVDLIMGSKDLNDMLRRISGIERITENDQDQISQLNALKAELEIQRSEVVRLRGEQEAQRQELEEQKRQAEELEASYNALVAQYEQSIAELQARKRSAQADMDSIRQFTITSAMAGTTIASVPGFVMPIAGGGRSAGTWAYPSGGLHLGLDWAVPIGTPVVAPADGLILYAANPVPSNSGYLGNWGGYPAGGGNTVEMLCNVNGTLYAISFAHLTREGMNVSAGQTVAQGQVIAATGNSGNSSGPHCHIEVYNLGNMSVEQAVQRFSSSADFAWGTGWNTTSTSCEATGGAAPCRERPEKFFS